MSAIRQRWFLLRMDVAALGSSCGFVVTLDPVLVSTEGVLGNRKIGSCGGLPGALVASVPRTACVTSVYGTCTGDWWATDLMSPHTATGRRHMCVP